MSEPPQRRPRPTEQKRAAGRSAKPPADTVQADEQAAGLPTDAVRELQLALRDAGFDPGSTDGIAGQATTEAVRRFQAANGLPADGIAGPQTLERLARAAANRAAAGSATVSGITATAAVKATPGEPSADSPSTAAARARIGLFCSKANVGEAELLVSAINAASPEVVAHIIVFAGPNALAADLDGVRLVVPCLSRMLVDPAGPERDALGQLASLVQDERAGVRVAPLLLEAVELGSTPFSDLQALGNAVPLSEAADSDTWIRSVAEEVVEVARPAGPRSYLPRFSADGLDGQDLLERRDRIEFLSSVLAAKQLETPLAIGLFGDWGSGKSFFMRRLQERIVQLTEASARAAKDGDPTLYCSHVRHVNFNAWLHSGADDIWPAFAAQVFREVGEEHTEAPQGVTQTRDLLAFQESLRKDEERLRTDAERKDRIRDLEQQLAEKRSQREGLVPEVGGPVGKAAGALYEIGARTLGLRSGWRELHASDVVLLVVAFGLGIAAYTVVHASLSVVIVGTTVVLGILRFLDGTWRLRRKERELKTELEHERVLAEKSRNTPASPELLLPEFAVKEAADWTRRAQLGTVTQIRMKFEALSRLLDEGAAASAKAGTPPDHAIPIERMIVYVDDLDRCQHDVVVNVLETLKLLVSLPHFVVVVGVDSRWLFRSLELHFRDLLHTDDGVSSDAAAWAATPQNYLEKIFQYSVVLKPITESGFANLIESLLAPPEPDGHETRPRGDSGTPAGPPSQGNDAGPIGEPPAGEPPARASTAAVGSEAPDLTPAELVITREEIEYIQGLAPLFETPRAAKRLANVYRLMRVSVGADRLMRDEGYEPALLLLAIGIGFPGLAGELFGAIRKQPGTVWPAFVKGLSVDDEAHRKLRSRLLRASPGAVADRNLKSFVPWIEDVAEFSFHPWQELLPAETQS